MKMYNRILVINIFGIGDVLFSTPMVRALRANFSEAKIDFMCNKRGQHIVQNNKNIDEFIVFEKDDFRNTFKDSKLRFIKKMYKFLREIRRNKYDLVIDLSLGYHLSLLLKILGVKKRIGFNYRNRGKFLTEKIKLKSFSEKHVVEYYLDVLKLIGIEETKDKHLELTLSDDLEKWADDFIKENKLEQKELIGVAPGGGKSWGQYAFYRRWSPSNFSYVAEKLALKRKDVFFFIFGSKEEACLCGNINETLKDKVMDLCDKVSLIKAIALMRRCKLLLCNDGGLLHIAVSQDIKTVSIFGPVDDNVYGPYPHSEKHKVAKAEGISCRPCYKNFKHKSCPTHECLEGIDKEKVLKFAEEALN